jgi:ubiquinone/menaquinone biosynthesis C-methylase UbiE
VDGPEQPLIAEAHARAYDAVVTDFVRRNAAMPPNVATLAADLLDRFPPCPRILDVGCGHGRDMAWLEAAGADVTGVDVSSGMLAEARTRVRGQLVQADMRALPFDDGTFDAIWCLASLLHLPKVEAPSVLDRFHRLLRADGVLVVAVKEGVGEAWTRDDGWPPRFFARYGSNELEALLRRAGFEPDPIRRSPGRDTQWFATLATRSVRRSRGATGSP